MPSISTFDDLLSAHTSALDDTARSAIEQSVWQRFGVRGTVFVLDMAGFSRTVQRRGIVFYLALVRQMQLLVEPIVKRCGGAVVKFEADNCFACFSQVDQAVEAALAIHIALEAENRSTPDDLDISVSMGIDHGDFLLIGEHEFFGTPVNRASKLGEDLGGPGDILVSREAMKHLKQPANYHHEERHYAISGTTIEACRIRHRGVS